jgi:adenylate cyclase
MSSGGAHPVGRRRRTSRGVRTDRGHSRASVVLLRGAMTEIRSIGTSFLVGRLRLTTGLVLFAYVATHDLNHMLGIVSLRVMEAAQYWFVSFWQFLPCALVLYVSLTLHYLLALWAIYQRRFLLRMRASEAFQLVFGLSIVPLLAQHVIGTRIASLGTDLHASYTYVLLSIWYVAPSKGILQAIGLLLAWIHGCIGMHFWLRLKSPYRRVQGYLLALAVLVPALALFGFVEAGREVARLAASPDWLHQTVATLHFPSRARIDSLTRILHGVYGTFAAALVLTLVARQGRFLIERRRGLVQISYPGGIAAAIVPGLTLLEASRLHGIPHAAVCGGRGRCSTCRVRIVEGLDTLAPPSAGEQSVLARVKASSDVRLACQIRPRKPMSVVPLLPPAAGPHDALRGEATSPGREQEIAILFADLHGFTRLSETRLPYDVVFLLNRYFAAMGQAIETVGGRVDKFIGDGVMALFGDAPGAHAGRACRQGLMAARAMGLALETLNERLAHELDEPLRIRIGLHVGPAIVGDMGFARAVSQTAIGDSVNTASRLESLAKDLGVELVVSEKVTQRAGIDASAYPPADATIRGRSETLKVHAIGRAADLPEVAIG